MVAFIQIKISHPFRWDIFLYLNSVLFFISKVFRKIYRYFAFHYAVRKIIIHIIRNSFLLLLALQVLNLSMNAIDFKPVHSSNMEEFNDLNTFSEYFAEVVMGHSNAFPESAKKEQKQSHLQKHMTIQLINPSVLGYLPNAYTDIISFRFPEDENHNRFYAPEINPPPPKA